MPFLQQRPRPCTTVAIFISAPASSHKNRVTIYPALISNNGKDELRNNANKKTLRRQANFALKSAKSERQLIILVFVHIAANYLSKERGKDNRR